MAFELPFSLAYFAIHSGPLCIRLRMVPTIVSAYAKEVARDVKEMHNTQDTRTGFVSCK